MRRVLDPTEQQVAEALGARIQCARLLNRLSQRELADALEVTRAAVSYYEHGHNRPRPRVLAKLARLLACDPEWLEHGRGRPPATPLFEGDVVPVGHGFAGTVLAKFVVRGEQLVTLSVKRAE